MKPTGRTSGMADRRAPPDSVASQAPGWAADAPGSTRDDRAAHGVGTAAGVGPAAAVLPSSWHRLLGLQRWPLRPLRLSARIVLLSLLLLLLVQVAGFSVIGQSISLNAQSQLQDRLRLASRVWDRLLEQRAFKLAQGAAGMAADHDVQESLSSRNPAAQRLVLDTQAQRLGVGLAAFLGPDLQVQAALSGVDPAWLSLLEQMAPGLAERPGSSRMALIQDTPFQLVLVPVKGSGQLGWVALGEPLDDVVVNEMADVSGLHATLVGIGLDGRPRVMATSLNPAAAALPLAQQPADGEMELAGDLHLVNTASVTSGRSGRVTLRLAGSLPAAMAPFLPLQWILAVITVLGLVLFGVGSHWMAQRITEPLRRLARASERLGRGDYDQPLLTTGRGDEIDDLAGAFDHMRVNIAEQQRQIRTLAYRDRLTGLPNRPAFRDEVASAMQRAGRRQQAMSVVVVDLDRFKQVNDVLGFAFGDRLLGAVALRLQQVVRAEDMVARLGGNSFGLLLRRADVRTAETLARRIASELDSPVQLDDQLVDLSAGVGIACWPQHAHDVDTLISRAEVAMYAAKRRTAGALVYDPSIDTASAQNLSLLSELRRAIDRGELRLFMQPKVRLSTGEAVAAEALVRWDHPSRGLLTPMDFIPFAEQTGFIRQLTLWVMGEVARLQPSLRQLGVERVSVNLSTRDLMDTELPTKLDAILHAHGAVPDGFCLEITESAIMDDPQRAEATLNRLSNRGFKLSIDDFGTGYSSLAYLKRLPVDELKIDKSFVMAMERDADDAKIVRSTIDLAHNLGLQVVAEGVESDAVLALLRALDCDEAQGFYMSAPLPVERYVQWLGDWSVRRLRQAGAGERAAPDAGTGGARSDSRRAVH